MVSIYMHGWEVQDDFDSLHNVIIVNQKFSNYGVRVEGEAKRLWWRTQSQGFSEFFTEICTAQFYFAMSALFSVYTVLFNLSFC